MSRKIKTSRDTSKNKLNFIIKLKPEHQNFKSPTPNKTPKREQLTRMYSLKQAPSDKTLELDNLK
jgi:hypothetical protein